MSDADDDVVVLEGLGKRDSPVMEMKAFDDSKTSKTRTARRDRKGTITILRLSVTDLSVFSCEER
jgi:hypothetical protein